MLESSLVQKLKEVGWIGSVVYDGKNIEIQLKRGIRGSELHNLGKYLQKFGYGLDRVFVHHEKRTLMLRFTPMG